MASYTVAAGKIGKYAKALTASTVDTVTFAGQVPVEVWSDGSAAVYFTVDGSTPVVGDDGTYELPAGAEKARTVSGEEQRGPTVVKLISAGTPVYSVSGTA